MNKNQKNNLLSPRIKFSIETVCFGFITGWSMCLPVIEIACKGTYYSIIAPFIPAAFFLYSTNEDMKLWREFWEMKE